MELAKGGCTGADDDEYRLQVEDCDIDAAKQTQGKSDCADLPASFRCVRDYSLGVGRWGYGDAEETTLLSPPP